MKLKKRRVITRSGTRARGFANSSKADHPVPWESLLERDAIAVWIFDPHIMCLSEHQEPIKVRTLDGEFTAYPDFRLIDIDGVEKIREVKSNDDLKQDEVAFRLEAIRRHYQSQDIEYQVISESEIRKEPRLTNITDLLPYHKTKTRNALLSDSCIRDFLLTKPSMALEELVDRLGSYGTAKRLLANGLLYVNLDDAIGPHTRVTSTVEELA
jgi:hypothetical protein